MAALPVAGSAGIPGYAGASAIHPLGTNAVSITNGRLPASIDGTWQYAAASTIGPVSTPGIASSPAPDPASEEPSPDPDVTDPDPNGEPDSPRPESNEPAPPWLLPPEGMPSEPRTVRPPQPDAMSAA